MDFSAFDEEEEVEETPKKKESEKKESEKSSSKDDTPKQSKASSILKMAGIVAVFSILSLIGGIVVGVQTAPKNESSVKTVQGVKSQNSVLDNLDSIKEIGRAHV